MIGGKSDERERKQGWLSVNNDAIYWAKKEWWAAVDGWGAGKKEKFNFGNVYIKYIYMSPKNGKKTVWKRVFFSAFK